MPLGIFCFLLKSVFLTWNIFTHLLTWKECKCPIIQALRSRLFPVEAGFMDKLQLIPRPLKLNFKDREDIFVPNTRKYSSDLNILPVLFTRQHNLSGDFSNGFRTIQSILENILLLHENQKMRTPGECGKLCPTEKRTVLETLHSSPPVAHSCIL